MCNIFKAIFNLYQKLTFIRHFNFTNCNIVLFIANIAPVRRQYILILSENLGYIVTKRKLMQLVPISTKLEQWK